MKLAIMQPYIFPYIGYFQLIHAVDKFIFYDDVNFIKQGWINRNNIMVNGNKFLFSLPVENISSFNKIKDVKISSTFHSRKNKLLKTIQFSYKKAGYFDKAYHLVNLVLEKDLKYISDYAKESIVAIMSYLGIETELVLSSEVYKNDNLSASERVIDICNKEKAGTYINPIGGQQLYDKEVFMSHGIDLYFLKSGDIVYPQLASKFIGNLSVIDLIMNNSRDECVELLRQYSLV